MNRIYFLIRTTDELFKIPDIKIFFGIFGWSVISIDAIYYQLIAKFNLNYFELEENDIFGFRFFGDSRPIIKFRPTSEDKDLVSNDYDYDQGYQKVKFAVTEIQSNSIMKAMKLFAKVLLEEEFDKRYNKLRYDGCNLEVQTWKDQIEESQKFLKGEPTPLLNLLANLKGITVEKLVIAINSKVRQNNQTIQNLFIQLVQLKTEFNNCATIEDINVLYFKYFGQQFNISFEYRKKRPDIFDENGNFIETIPLHYNF